MNFKRTILQKRSYDKVMKFKDAEGEREILFVIQNHHLRIRTGANLNSKKSVIPCGRSAGCEEREKGKREQKKNPFGSVHNEIAHISLSLSLSLSQKEAKQNKKKARKQPKKFFFSSKNRKISPSCPFPFFSLFLSPFLSTKHFGIFFFLFFSFFFVFFLVFGLFWSRNRSL